jgi:hypothetical protein
MFVFPDAQLYAVACDRIERAAELMPMIKGNLQNLRHRDHGPIHDALHRSVRDYYNQRATYEVLPKFLLTPEQWMAEKIDDRLREQVMEEWIRFYFGCELIVGTFSDSGQALLYYIKGNALRENENGISTVEFVTSSSIPGFLAIGSGAHNAEFWLGYRKHTLSCSPKRAAYHAYEAKLMAESSAHVNELTEMLIATKEQRCHLTPKQPESEEWSLREYAKLYAEYGPRSTEPLGIPLGTSEKRDKLFN